MRFYDLVSSYILLQNTPTVSLAVIAKKPIHDRGSLPHGDFSFEE